MEQIMPLCGLSDRSLWPNACNLNMYSGGSQAVGWHADDESLFQSTYEPCTIISLFLGQTRDFELRAKRVLAEFTGWPSGTAK